MTIAAGLAAVAEAVHLEPDRLRARVGDETIEADGARALWSALSGALYERFHIGQANDPTIRPGTRDLPLESALTEAVPHRLSKVLAPVYEQGESSWVVDLLGVRVRLPADRVLSLTEQAPGERSLAFAPTGPGQIGRALIQADAIRPTLSPGFFLVDGSAGTVLGDGPILRLYVHLAAPAHAAPALRTALSLLEERELPYRAKAFSRSSGYPRRDALVIYLEEPAWPALASLVAALSTAEGLVDDVSAFAHRVGPGLAIAWDPVDTRVGMRLLSFGEHRARLVAEALLAAASGEGTPAEALHSSLTRGGVDPALPYRNLSSPALEL
ncbi:T3SS effector HopA1 family protein [Nonomuraea sp. NPDC050310]|uniref:T3SS effector HopA1 family protein n=1 Tax=unclassified Nonomuraea TaxID=2593643 RepID=UPI0033CB9C05